MGDTIQVRLELSCDLFAALPQDPEHFVPQMRLAAAAKWYELVEIPCCTRRHAS